MDVRNLVLRLKKFTGRDCETTLIHACNLRIRASAFLLKGLQCVVSVLGLNVDVAWTQSPSTSSSMVPDCQRSSI
eukprot:3265454-Amphidinium_carterae.1